MPCRHSVFRGCNCWERNGENGTSPFKLAVAGTTGSNHDRLAGGRRAVDVEDRREDCNSRHRMGMDKDDSRGSATCKRRQRKRCTVIYISRCYLDDRSELRAREPSYPLPHKPPASTDAGDSSIRALLLVLAAGSPKDWSLDAVGDLRPRSTKILQDEDAVDNRMREGPKIP
jgi:hypothetical protein